MNLAIMQPYLFPHIGYFQLINAADKFVIYDDVNFIKGGWINRNNILVNKKANLFTLPLSQLSPFTLIKSTEINRVLFAHWKNKFFRTVEQAYKKAPYYKIVLPIISEGFNITSGNSISKLAITALRSVCNYLEIQTPFVESSSIYNNKHLSGKERVIDICKQEKAEQYINTIGGKELYDKTEFEANSIKLNFIKSKKIIYKQFDHEFVPSLSIIDVMMFNSPVEINEMLNQYILE